MGVENPEEDKRDFQKQIDEDTQETKAWIFSNGIYARWKNADDESVLWIFGEDGLGKTPLTISLIDDLTNRVERSSRRRTLAYCFCISHTGQKKDATAVIRGILYQVILQLPDEQHAAFGPWLKAYHKQDDATHQPNHLLNLWRILQLTLAKAQIEIAYFLLYRPEDCGSSILNDFPSLTAEPMYTECHIKWIVISRLDPSSYHHIETPRQINLATAPPDEPILPPSSTLTATSDPIPPNSGSTEASDYTSPTTPDVNLPSPMESSMVASVYVKHKQSLHSFPLQVGILRKQRPSNTEISTKTLRV